MLDEQQGMSVPLAELFVSISGEVGGLFSQGSQCIFIRLSGCNLRCSWCDTPKTQTVGDRVASVDSIIKRVIELRETQGVRNVVITGGEPLLYQAAVFEILKGLAHYDFKYSIHKKFQIQIETNGTIHPITLLSELGELEDTLEEDEEGDSFTLPNIGFVVDYKTNYVEQMHLTLFGLLDEKDVIKIVVKTEHDLVQCSKFLQKNQKEKICSQHVPVFIGVDPQDKHMMHQVWDMMDTYKYSDIGINVQIHKLLDIR